MKKAKQTLKQRKEATALRPLKVIISGGGTGGHIFPAIAIAKGLKEKNPGTEILFVGAKGKMEMEKVPAHGFEIIGLDMMGIQRRLTWKNLLVPFKLIGSLFEARKIIKRFKPDVAIGVGGYASAPLLYAAQQMKVPTLIQEQNSYAGLANKWLGKRARKICVAFSGMEKYFPASRIVLTGNPVRNEIVNSKVTREEAIDFFRIQKERKVLLVIGGSLGALTINESIEKAIPILEGNSIQLIWQTGKGFHKRAESHRSQYVSVHQFVERMDMAYAAADLVVSRAGALSIAELCVIGKPVILVPSPNVAEDHQTKNAKALADENAAVLISDAAARTKLADEIIAVMNNPHRRTELSNNIRRLAKPDAADSIVEQVYGIVK